MQCGPAVIVALLLLVDPGCARTAPGRPPGGESVGTPRTRALSEILIGKEREIWDVQKRRDVDALRQMLPEGAYIVEDDDGRIVTKEQFIEALPDLIVDRYEMADAVVVPVTRTVGIVRYRVRVAGSFGGKAFVPHWSTVSSVWVDEGGVWKNMAYQETRIR